MVDPAIFWTYEKATILGTLRGCVSRELLKFRVANRAWENSHLSRQNANELIRLMGLVGRDRSTLLNIGQKYATNQFTTAALVKNNKNTGFRTEQLRLYLFRKLMCSLFFTICYTNTLLLIDKKTLNRLSFLGGIQFCLTNFRWLLVCFAW